MDDEIQSLVIRDTWEIVSRKSVADKNVLPGTWSFKCKRKPDSKIRKLKARYYVSDHSEVNVHCAVYYRFAESNY